VSARIAVLDYGMGNLHSVARALDRVGADVVVTARAAELADADALVIPGVGQFGACVRALRVAGLEDVELDPELREPRHRRLEDAVRPGRLFLTAAVLRVQPVRVAHVDDEPAFSRGREAGAGVFEPRLGHGASLTIGEIGQFRPRRTGQRFPIRYRHMALELS